ncbi:hypothetical protein EB001_19235 [bacterium]|nr:hypothetical protein [bacterium]
MMNKLVIYFDQTDIDSLMPVGPIPKCLIFHNYYDAVDWLKRHDCKWEEKFPKQLLREAEDLCYEHHVEYDERKIFVTTDYGSHVIIFYREKDE